MRDCSHGSVMLRMAAVMDVVMLCMAAAMDFVVLRMVVVICFVMLCATVVTDLSYCAWLQSWIV